MRFAAAIAASNIFSLQNLTGIPGPNEIVAGYAIRNLIVEIKIYILYVYIYIHIYIYTHHKTY